MKISRLGLQRFKPFHWIVVGFGLLIFIILLILAAKTPDGVSPDEYYHLMFPVYYLKHSIDPFLENQDTQFYLGELTRVRSYLYPYLLSWVLRATPFIEDQRSVLRVSTVLISMVNYGLVYWLASILLKRKAAILSALILLYSLLMYLFLGAFINYDNLALTFTLLMTLFYLKFYNTGASKWVLLFVISSILGSLAKFSVLPLVVLFGAIFLINKKTYKLIYPLKNLTKVFTDNKVLTLILVFASLLFIERYGYNIYEYQSTQPACDLVQTVEECRQNPVYERSFRIDEKGDVGELVSTWEYAQEWSKRMYQGTVGIMSHKYFPAWNHAKLFLAPVVLTAIAGFAFLFYKRKFKESRFDLLFVIIGYVLILLFGVHLPGYRNSGLIALAIQGRYLFPVLPLAVVMLFYYSEYILKGKWLYLLLGLMGFFFVMQVYYLFNNIELLWG